MHDPLSKRLDRPVWEDGAELLLGAVVLVVVLGGFVGLLWVLFI
jgi:hypothetical protein